MASDAPSGSASQNARFVEGLDHLRAIAALLVVFHHSYWQAAAMRCPDLVFAAWPRTENPLFAPIIETHFTMAIFFVLSGFVLSLCTYGRCVQFGGYLRNRCLRVLPVFLVVLLLGVAIYPGRFTLSGFLATATVFGSVPDGGLQLDPVNTVLWTVAVEFQFYVVHFMLVWILVGDLGHHELLPGYMLDFVRRYGVSVYENAALNTLLMVMPVVLAASYLLHRAVELPFMGLRGRYTMDLDREACTP